MGKEYENLMSYFIKLKINKKYVRKRGRNRKLNYTLFIIG